ncbi:MAG TPA: FixH family protein, partial [Usitatibacteraceae bacterium]|nr:FixH family protein [Usitatibacteraceae bacterium]
MTVTHRIVLAALVAWLAGCAAAPSSAPAARLDLALEKPSRDGKFRVALVPPRDGPAVNRIDSWSIRLMTPAGEPIRNGLVYLNGGMPEHGHGLPTRPRTYGEVAPGLYQVDGVKLSMTGWWEMLVAIQANGTEDFAT